MVEDEHPGTRKIAENVEKLVHATITTHRLTNGTLRATPPDTPHSLELNIRANRTLTFLAARPVPCHRAAKAFAALDRLVRRLLGPYRLDVLGDVHLHLRHGLVPKTTRTALPNRSLALLIIFTFLITLPIRYRISPRGIKHEVDGVLEPPSAVPPMPGVPPPRPSTTAARRGRFLRLGFAGHDAVGREQHRRNARRVLQRTAINLAGVITPGASRSRRTRRSARCTQSSAWSIPKPSTPRPSREHGVVGQGLQRHGKSVRAQPSNPGRDVVLRTANIVRRLIIALRRPSRTRPCTREGFRGPFEHK